MTVTEQPGANPGQLGCATRSQALVPQLCWQGDQSLLASLLELERQSPLLQAADLGERVRQRLAAQPATPLSPWIYLIYYRIGQAVLSGERQSSGLDELLEWMATELPLPPEPDGVLSFQHPSRPAWQWRHLLELFQEGGDFVADLTGVESAVAARWRMEIGAVRSLIAAVDPPLHQCMRRLQQLGVLSRPLGSAVSFGGATSFFFRGGSLINCSASLKPARLIERLVHEYAHSELFVIGQDSRLCHNEDSERHRVLIRQDPRPMHGIIHSLYVTGRCAELFRRMQNGGLDGTSAAEGLQEDIKPMLERLTTLGRSSLAAVQGHARLTDRGAEVVAVSLERLDLKRPDGR
ncbi:MAG: HEXXH motif-containing putative peptide modification protein [Cyanobacteria bacterium J06638_7]